MKEVATKDTRLKGAARLYELYFAPGSISRFGRSRAYTALTGQIQENEVLGMLSFASTGSETGIIVVVEFRELIELSFIMLQLLKLRFKPIGIRKPILFWNLPVT